MMSTIYQRIYDEWHRATRTAQDNMGAEWFDLDGEDRDAIAARLLPIDVVEAVVERSDEYNSPWVAILAAELDRRNRWWT